MNHHAKIGKHVSKYTYNSAGWTTREIQHIPQGSKISLCSTAHVTQLASYSKSIGESFPEMQAAGT